MQILASSLVVLAAIFLLTGCMSGAYTYEKVNTSGTVVVMDKDAAGKVTKIEIKTDLAESFTVENSGKGKELLGMIDKKVEISGKARLDQGKKLLTVESYKVIG